MAAKNDCWGIEVGAYALKALRLVRSGQNISVEDFDILPFKQILTTPDLDVDEAIQVQLDNFLQKHDVTKSSVVVSVPGHMAFARFAKLPPVEPKKIKSIVRYEAQQQIPFPIEDVEWDYQVFQQEDSPDVEVGIFAITKEKVMTFLTNYRRVNMTVDALTLSPLAVYNAFSHEGGAEGLDEGTIYMDIGTQSTDVIIVENGGIWLRTLPIGGNNFTEALVNSFKLSFPKAEKLKREARTSKYARQIFQAMRPVFADLVQEIQRSVGYYQSRNRDSELTRLVGVGSTFRLPGLTKFLKQQLQMDVVRPEGYKNLDIDGKREAEFAENAMNFATAYGCALQGLGLDKVSSNVMPSAIMNQRLWRAKQPWIAAAAACVALACVLSVGRYFMDASAYAASAEENDGEIKSVLSYGRDRQSRLGELDSEASPLLRVENVRRILDYRDLWPKIIEDISLAAASTNPQLPTVGNDYDLIKAIQRSQRERVYIDSVEAQYAASGQALEAGQAMPITEMLASGRSVDEFFSAATEDEVEGVSGPQILISVTGTTPRENAGPFLRKTFIQWLKDNADRPDRPYRIVYDQETVLSNFGQLRETDPSLLKDTTASRSAVRPRTSRTRTPAGGGYPGGGYPGGDYPGAGYPGGGYPGGAGGYGTTGRGATALGELIPVNPLSDESIANDYKFTITWTVELLRPTSAREAAKGMLKTSPAEDPETPAEEAGADQAAIQSTDEKEARS